MTSCFAIAAALAVAGPVLRPQLIDSDRLMTEPIQAAIDACHAQDGGEVVIPAGVFRTGGLVLKSGVTLRLEDGARLEGSRNPDDYPTGPDARRWYRGLIRADGAHDIAVIGGRGAVLSGMNCYDPKGEERYRGPHGILFFGCTNVVLSGYSFRDSGNWAHALFKCRNLTVRDVKVFGGHDGLDVHDSEDALVERCEFHCGDDAIAGFANHHVTVRDCLLDCSCNAIRFGGSDSLFERCRVPERSTWGHRWTLTEEQKRASVTDGRTRHGVCAFFCYYCDMRWQIRRPQSGIVVRDCDVEAPVQSFGMAFDGRNQWCCNRPLVSIAFENCHFRRTTVPANFIGGETEPLALTFDRCSFAPAPGHEGEPLVSGFNFSRIFLKDVSATGYARPRIERRSAAGVVEITGGTALETVSREDPDDRILTFGELERVLEVRQGDEAGWTSWANGVSSSDDLSTGNYWGLAMAVWRGEVRSPEAVGRRFRGQYSYCTGFDRNGKVAERLGGALSDLPAGPFAFALAQYDPVSARAFLTDYVRSKIPPSEASVWGVRKALEKLTDRTGGK